MWKISLSWPQNPLGEIDCSSRREWSTKSPLSPAQTQWRQDALFHGQGRSSIDARSVLPVREHGNMARTPLAAFFNIPLERYIVHLPILINLPALDGVVVVARIGTTDLD